MSGKLTHTPDPSIRQISTGLNAANDGQVTRIVAVIDAIPMRGRVDDLLAGIRPRLARLRPPRPLRFARLLFMPLDTVVVAPPLWSPGAPAIPRSALHALAATVHAALGPAADEIEALIAGRATSDAAVVAEAGGRLWPTAADILLGAPTPVAWDRTGLPVSAYHPLARMAGAVLAQSAALDRLAADASLSPDAPQAEELAAVLAATTALDRDALPLLMVVLLARIPHGLTTLLQVPRTTQIDDRAVRHAIEHARDMVIDRLQAGDVLDSYIARADLQTARGVVQLMNGLLAELQVTRPTPLQRERLQRIRTHVDQVCRARFGDGMTQDFLQPLSDLDPAAPPAAVEALEEAARGLRALEAEGRQIGSGPIYDDLLRQADAAIRASHAAPALTLADRARLLEIMSGTEAALGLLQAPD